MGRLKNIIWLNPIIVLLVVGCNGKNEVVLFQDNLNGTSARVKVASFDCASANEVSECSENCQDFLKIQDKKWPGRIWHCEIK
jgi:uncharacterized lipoprotein YehR (DUF1307 family)